MYLFARNAGRKDERERERKREREEIILSENRLSPPAMLGGGGGGRGTNRGTYKGKNRGNRQGTRRRQIRGGIGLGVRGWKRQTRTGRVS